MTHYFQALSWRFTLPKKTWLRYAIHDPGLLHGVLAIAAAHYSFATTRGLSDDALFHHGKTINHVQKCLQDPVLRFSDGVIGAIGRMVICHLIFGSRQHFITHIKALQRSAEARGGLENLGMIGQLKYIIASCVAGAANMWWEDVPPQLRHPYGPLDYPAVDDVPDAEPHDPDLGSAFRELNKTGFVSDTLLDICEAMIALNSVITSRRTWNEPQQRVFGDQCNKISIRLIYLKDDETASHGKRTPCDHMRECMRLAVHFYVSIFQRDVPLLSNVSIQTLHQLRDCLYLTDLETSWGGGQLGEVLLWILIITASGCVRPQERECAGAQLRKTATQLGVTTWSEVKQICRNFLFLESAMEWKTWPLWKDYGPRLEDDLSPTRPEVSLLQREDQVVIAH
jgi:Fungal specific transcription factor domain